MYTYNEYRKCNWYEKPENSEVKHKKGRRRRLRRVEAEEGPV
jgi:ribosomal protein S21